MAMGGGGGGGGYVLLSGHERTSCLAALHIAYLWLMYVPAARLVLLKSLFPTQKKVCLSNFEDRGRS